jgi:hypothetical protein
VEVLPDAKSTPSHAHPASLRCDCGRAGVCEFIDEFNERHVNLNDDGSWQHQLAHKSSSIWNMPNERVSRPQRHECWDQLRRTKSNGYLHRY